jgi:hypothetical protein
MQLDSELRVQQGAGWRCPRIHPPMVMKSTPHPCSGVVNVHEFYRRIWQIWGTVTTLQFPGFSFHLRLRNYCRAAIVPILWTRGAENVHQYSTFSTMAADTSPTLAHLRLIASGVAALLGERVQIG